MRAAPSGLLPANWSGVRAIFGHVRPGGAGGAIKRKRFTEEQIAFALRQAEAGTSVEEVCRRMGVSEPTYYRASIAAAGRGGSAPAGDNPARSRARRARVRPAIANPARRCGQPSVNAAASAPISWSARARPPGGAGHVMVRWHPARAIRRPSQ
jgi:transposase-like protein